MPVDVAVVGLDPILVGERKPHALEGQVVRIGNAELDELGLDTVARFGNGPMRPPVGEAALEAFFPRGDMTDRGARFASMISSVSKNSPVLASNLKASTS